jgi:hypothetical protein
MTDPSEESLQRATTALTPFVRSFDLPVNPEDLWLMAYVVLRFADSAEEPPVIVQAVEELIADELAARKRMWAAQAQASVGDHDQSGQASDA